MRVEPTTGAVLPTRSARDHPALRRPAAAIVAIPSTPEPLIVATASFAGAIGRTTAVPGFRIVLPPSWRAITRVLLGCGSRNACTCAAICSGDATT